MKNYLSFLFLCLSLTSVIIGMGGGAIGGAAAMHMHMIVHTEVPTAVQMRLQSQESSRPVRIKVRDNQPISELLSFSEPSLPVDIETGGGQHPDTQMPMPHEQDEEENLLRSFRGCIHRNKNCCKAVVCSSLAVAILTGLGFLLNGRT